MNEKESSDKSLEMEAPSIEEANHFDELIEGLEEEVEPPKEVNSKFVPKNEWVQGLIDMHLVASGLTKINAIALPNGHVSKEQAEHLFGLWYDQILKIRFLQFLLLPGSDLLILLSSSAIYAMGMKAAIDEELAARKPEKPQEVSKPKTNSGTQPINPENFKTLSELASEQE